MPMNAASVVPAWEPIMPPVLAATASRAPSTWRGPARPRNWVDQLDHLGDAGGTQRMAAADQAAARVDGHPGAADGGVARHGGRSGVTGLEETERFEGVELLGAGGVVQLDEIDVGGLDAGVVPGGRGRLGPGARGSRGRRCPIGPSRTGSAARRHARSW